MVSDVYYGDHLSFLLNPFINETSFCRTVMYIVICR